MAQPPPLDETEFDQPWLLHELPGGNLNSDSLLWYFYNSPFFDRTSNNSALINQLRSHPDGQAIMFSRQAFEEKLSNFAHGVQFKCVAEPQAPGQPWVLQKQFKTVHAETGRPITQVQATYYTQGTKIFMAPSLLDVVQLRLLTTATQLQELYDLSKNLSQFAPGAGHSYLPPAYELPKAAATASRIGSPSLAATEPADAPASQSQSQSQAQRTTEPGETTTVFSDSLFLQSLRFTNDYYDEFMDENPLQGEPGAFVYSNTHGQVLAKKEQKDFTGPTTASPDVKPEPQSTGNSVAATPKTGVIVATPGGLASLSRKGSIAGVPKVKRKKSKGLGTPVTPTAPPF
jgi:mediator of RNA polymerase II transcription subunit 6